MSAFSGKYDFRDNLEENNAFSDWEKFKENTKIYIDSTFGTESKELFFGSLRDLAPYYSHVVLSSVTHEGKRLIHISSKSWIELEKTELSEITQQLTKMRKARKRTF